MKPTKQMIAEHFAKLDDWLAKMEPAIDDFIQSFPADERGKLDYSLDSIDIAEARLPKKIIGRKNDSDADDSELVTAVEYYVFAVAKRHLPGARWDVFLMDTSIHGYGSPQLKGPDDHPFVYRPQMGAAIFRDNSGVLRGLLEDVIRHSPPEYRGKRRPAEFVSEQIRQEWLGETEDALDYFLEWLPAETSGQLDLSPESLDVLEKWLRTVDFEITDLYTGMHPHLSDGAAIYIGEVFRRKLGGSWDIPMGAPLAKTFQRPVVRIGEKPAVIVYPLEMIGDALHNPKRLQWKKECERVRGKVGMGEKGK